MYSKQDSAGGKHVEPNFKTGIEIWQCKQILFNTEHMFQAS